MSKKVIPRVHSPFKIRNISHKTSFSQIPSFSDLSQTIHPSVCNSVYSLAKLREKQSKSKTKIKIKSNSDKSQIYKPKSDESIPDSTQPSLERHKTIINLENRLSQIQQLQEPEEKYKLAYDIWEQFLMLSNPDNSLLNQVKIIIVDWIQHLQDKLTDFYETKSELAETKQTLKILKKRFKILDILEYIQIRNKKRNWWKSRKI